MTASHRRIDKVQPQHAKRECVSATAFLRKSGQGSLDVPGLLDISESGRECFANQELYYRVGSIEDAGTMILAVLVP